MPRPVWSGTISFGLVAIPIKLFHAVSRKSVSFNQLDDRTMSRIKLRKVSAETGEGLEPLKDEIFGRLGIIRVYTKQPGKPPDQGRPYVLKIGSTVLDLCQMVHHDFVEHLAFARVWGKHTFEGQRINRDHVLADGDVIELHR